MHTDETSVPRQFKPSEDSRSKGRNNLLLTLRRCSMNAEIRDFSKGLLKMAAAAVVLIVLATGLPLLAQSTTGSLGGVVRDASGSVVPGATVMVRNIATGFTQTAVTEESGTFLLSLLPVGDYELRVEKAGFTSLCTVWHTTERGSGRQPERDPSGGSGVRTGDRAAPRPS